MFSLLLPVRTSSDRGIAQSRIVCATAAVALLLLAGFRCKAQQLPAAPSEPICSVGDPQRAVIRVCTLNVQAGIPYIGKVAEYQRCPEKQLEFMASWDGTSGRSAVKEDRFSPGALVGTHTWRGPGQYELKIESHRSISKSETSSYLPSNGSQSCADSGSSASGLVHVFAPAPPISMFISGRNLQPGRTYTNAGAVALKEAAPESGMLLTIETDQPDKIDVQTSFGRTGHGRKRTYLWVKPGSNTRTFDVIVAPGLPEEFQAQIRSDCAGTIVAKSECDSAFTGIDTAKTFTIKTRENPKK